MFSSRRLADRAAVRQVLVGAALWAIAGGLDAADRIIAPPAAEATKQEFIYRSRGADVPEGYVTGRSLASYAALLPTGFDAELRRLRPEHRWLDVGAGGGRAVLDYYLRDAPGNAPQGRPHATERAFAVAVSIEDRRSPSWPQQAAAAAGHKLSYLHGRRLRDYTAAELGRFQLVTDVYGGFSYTDDLAGFVQKVLAALEVDGAFYTLLQSVHLADGSDPPNTWYLTEIVDGAGRDVKVCTWLQGIPCVRVRCESRGTWDAPTELIRIRKICGDTAVPALELLTYEAGTPPGRRFRLKTTAGRRS